MNKPVWRMNSGQGVPSDLGESTLRLDGWMSEPIFSVRNIDLAWSHSVHNNPIIAYKTTRTRKAKYERVECGECKATGRNFSRLEDGSLHSDHCDWCNGKGYTLEAIK